jgi:hypothetical protein
MQTLSTRKLFTVADFYKIAEYWIEDLENDPLFVYRGPDPRCAQDL